MSIYCIGALAMSVASPAFLAPGSLPFRAAKRGLVVRACAAGPSSSPDVARAIARAAQTTESVAAFTTLDADAATASSVDSGKDGPLAGRAFAVKDNLCTAGVVTTASSRILEDYVPPYTATAVRRVEEAGGIVFGKTNMDEFGMGSSTETSAYGVTRNPWDTSRVPGGSSGGSAAAVAAGICDFALGTDTGGSIRQPASFCGVTGLKPSYGRVSRHGLLAYASSLDTVGPITRSVEDAARVLQIIAGSDPMDSTTVADPVPDYLALLQEPPADSAAPLSGITVGVVSETMSDGASEADVSARVREAVDTLRSLGASIQEVSLPRVAVATAAYYVLAPSEASANLARYDGVRYGVRSPNVGGANEMYTRSRAEGFGDEVKRRICVGTYALSTGYYDAYYLRAQRVRSLVREDYRRAFADGIDVLVSPVAPTTAFRIGEKTGDTTAMYYGDVMTIPPSLAGLPALSVPCGFCSDGMPVGLQIVGPYLDEATILKVGHAFQSSTDFHERESPVAKELADVQGATTASSGSSTRPVATVF